MEKREINLLWGWQHLCNWNWLTRFEAGSICVIETDSSFPSIHLAFAKQIALMAVELALICTIFGELSYLNYCPTDSVWNRSMSSSRLRSSKFSIQTTCKSTLPSMQKLYFDRLLTIYAIIGGWTWRQSKGLWKLMHLRWRLFQTQRYVLISFLLTVVSLFSDIRVTFLEWLIMITLILLSGSGWSQSSSARNCSWSSN